MSYFYTNEHLSQNLFYYWYGQVLGDWEGNEVNKLHLRDGSTSSANSPPSTPKSNTQSGISTTSTSGWGKRYKVAILGRDPKIVSEGADNNNVAMADIILPVTAGSGLGGGVQTSNIAQNTFVIGFYKDGVNCREPVIMGILPNFSQTVCKPYNSNEETRYNPATGFNPSNASHYVPDYNIWTQKGKHIIKESNDGGFVNALDAHSIRQWEDGKISDLIPSTFKGKGAGGEMFGIAKILQDGVNLLNKIKNEPLDFLNTVSSLQKSIKSVKSTVTMFISTLMKNMMQKMRSFINSKINKISTSLVATFPPNLRYKTSSAIEKTVDALNCIFNSIITKLTDIVGDLVENLLDKAVNVPMQVAEHFIGGSFTSILGDITGGIASALGGITSLSKTKPSNSEAEERRRKNRNRRNSSSDQIIVNEERSRRTGVGTTSQAAEGAEGGIGAKPLDALNLVFGFMEFLKCEKPAKNPTIDQWSFWYGANNFSPKSSQNVGDILNNIATTPNTLDSQSTGPSLCEPPTIELEGGGGSGFKANPVISKSGKVIAFDVVDPGSGYTSTPIAKFGSNCGIGNGAVLMPLVSRG